MNKIKNFDNFALGSINVLKNITQEIIQECIKSEIEIDETLATYAINMYSLNPKNGIKFSSQVNRLTVEEFIRNCVDKFTDYNHPALIALGIQAKFITNSINKREIIAEQQEKLQQKTSKLTREIIETHALTKDDRDKLIKKIAVDVIVYNGLGNPSNGKIVSETIQALHSIMSKTDLQAFVGLNRNDKMDSLTDIREIVCGIRVFNKDAGHPAEGVINLTGFIEQTCNSTKTMLDINLYETMNRVNLLTSTITSMISFDPETYDYNIQYPDSCSEDDFEHMKLVLILNRQMELYLRQLLGQLSIIDSDVSSDIVRYCSIEHMKLVLILNRQMELYLRQLLGQLSIIDSDVSSDIVRFKRILEELHHSVQFKAAVPTELVFPNFKQLGQMWSQLHNLIFVLSQINILNSFLSEQSDLVPNYDEIAFSILNGTPVETDEERLKRYKKTIYNPENFIDDGTIVEYTTGTKIELLGFCVNSIAEGNGILVPGNPKLGLGLYKTKYYSSSSILGLKMFQKNPEIIVYKVLRAARANPELIVFLDIFEQVKHAEHEFAGKTFSSKTVRTCDTGMQTELHPVPYAKDKDYVWNVWDLRRRAIQLANLRNCRTKSAQTHETYSSFSIESQTMKPKVQSAQTRKNMGIVVAMDKNKELQK